MINREEFTKLIQKREQERKAKRDAMLSETRAKITHLLDAASPVFDRQELIDHSTLRVYLNEDQTQLKCMAKRPSNLGPGFYDEIQLAYVHYRDDMGYCMVDTFTGSALSWHYTRISEVVDRLADFIADKATTPTMLVAFRKCV